MPEISIEAPAASSSRLIDDQSHCPELRYRRYTPRKQRQSARQDEERQQLDNHGEGSSRTWQQRAKPQKRRIAIIGTGLAGLVAAHHLTETPQRRAQYEVHLFERGGALGLDAASFDVDEEKDDAVGTVGTGNVQRKRQSQRVDVPMRSINAGYYPNLIRLYRRLGIPLRNNDFTFSFRAMSRAASTSASQKRHSDAPFLIYNGQNGLRGLALPSNQRARLASLARPWKGLSTAMSSLFYLVDYVRLIAVLLLSYMCLLAMALFHHLQGNLLDPQHKLSSEPLYKWAARHPRAIHPTFFDTVLVPLFSAVATSSHAAVLEMPAAEMLLYVATTFLRNHIAVVGGVKQVQEALVRNVDAKNIHLNAGVQRVTRTPVEAGGGGTRFRLITYKHSNQNFDFDHIIVATPASFAAALLQGLEAADKCVDRSDLSSTALAPMHQQLARVKYETSTVVTHTDSALLPRNVEDRRDLNLVTPALVKNINSSGDSDEDVFGSGKMHLQYTAATHVLGSLKSGKAAQPSKTLLQTTNPVQWPTKQSTLSTTSFQRAITPSSKHDIEGLFVWRRAALRQSMSLFAHVWNRFGWRQRDADAVADEGLNLRGDGISEAVALARRYVPLTKSRRHPKSPAREDHNDKQYPFTLHLGSLQGAQTQRDAPAGPCVWVCGSYAQGIPLLEGCVTSSTLVARAILCDEREVSV